MATLTLDTHKFIQTLKKAGVPERQAEAIVQGFQDMRLEHVATHEDLQAVRTELAELRTEVLASKAEMIKWIATMLVGQVVVIAALVKLL